MNDKTCKINRFNRLKSNGNNTYCRTKGTYHSILVAVRFVLPAFVFSLMLQLAFMSPIPVNALTRLAFPSTSVHEINESSETAAAISGIRDATEIDSGYISYSDTADDISLAGVSVPLLSIAANTMRLAVDASDDVVSNDIIDNDLGNAADADRDGAIGIHIVNPPDKLSYYANESLDLDGLAVHVMYADGSEAPVDFDALEISGFDSSIEGSMQEIVVVYAEFFDTFLVSVIARKTLIDRVTENPLLAMALTALLLLFVIILSHVLKKSKRKRINQTMNRNRNMNSSGYSDASVIGQKIPIQENKKWYQQSNGAAYQAGNQPQSNDLTDSKRSRRRNVAGQPVMQTNKPMMNQNTARNGDPASNKPKKKRKRKWLLIIPAVLLAILLLGYGGLLNLLSGFDRETIATDDDALGIDDGISDRRIVNIAVFGIDSTDGMTGRSDTIMILTLDEKHDKIKITSIVRDAYVDIPGRGLDKINHAYAFGGPELAIKTINQNFKLDIRHYISLNFSSMPAIVDTIGGVEVKITDKEAALISGISTGGTYTLDGKQALQFARIRKIDSDFERSRRQRDVMEATIKAAFEKPLTSYPGMLSDVFPYMKTNLSSNQMLNLGRKAVMNNIRDIEQVQFPTSTLGKGEIINGIYYFVFDRTVGAEKLSQYIFNDVPIEN